MTENFSSPKEIGCPICGSNSYDKLYTLKNVPVFCNVLHDTREDAINTAKGEIALVFCNDCGHIFNRAFDPALMAYSVEYENSLHFSKKFQEFADLLARYLIEKYDVRSKNVIEIGCGKGDFLKIICKQGSNHGYGFDTSYVFNEADEKNENVTFYQEFYSNKFSKIQADLVLCRHVLEHIENPCSFIQEIKSVVNQYNPVFYFEVPNALYTLRDLGIWDLIYEHYSYYNPHSLSRLFHEVGFGIYNLRESYNKQFLGIEFGTGGDRDINHPLTLGELKRLADNFAKSYEEKIKYWKDLLQCYKNNGKKVVLWGGGSKGVTFLNVFYEYDILNEVVDINPRKQGKYVSGTGQRYVAPEELLERDYDAVIVMNPIYTEEIQVTLKKMGLTAELIKA